VVSKQIDELKFDDLANLILKNIFYILLHLLQEQASWVCQCEDTVVQQLQEDFKQTLERQNSLEQWAIWLEGVVNKVLKPHEGTDLTWIMIFYVNKIAKLKTSE
jgi:regulatory factor X 1/2/3